MLVLKVSRRMTRAGCSEKPRDIFHRERRLMRRVSRETARNVFAKYEKGEPRRVTNTLKSKRKSIVPDCMVNFLTYVDLSPAFYDKLNRNMCDNISGICRKRKEEEEKNKLRHAI